MQGDTDHLQLRKDFCVLIISFGRAENCKTARLLEKNNYNHPWYIVCSTDDVQLPLYKKKYGERVVVYDKDEVGKIFDKGDNFGRKNLGVYARQACFLVAEQLGYKYFLSLDDDYTGLNWRYPDVGLTKLCCKKCLQYAKVFEAMLQFMDTSGAWEVDFMCGGDLMGGIKDKYAWRDLGRKAMNSHFNRVDKPIRYNGAFNDDVNAYVRGWYTGRMFFCVPLLQVTMDMTQQTGGGMSLSYIELGTYAKSFYTLMLHPAAVKISMIGRTSKRLHHNIDWQYVSPMILHEKWKKKN